MFCFGKSYIGFPCALTAPKRPASATPAVPCIVSHTLDHECKTVNYLNRVLISQNWDYREIDKSKLSRAQETTYNPYYKTGPSQW